MSFPEEEQSSTFYQNERRLTMDMHVYPLSYRHRWLLLIEKLWSKVEFVDKVRFTAEYTQIKYILERISIQTELHRVKYYKRILPIAEKWKEKVGEDDFSDAAYFSAHVRSKTSTPDLLANVYETIFGYSGAEIINVHQFVYNRLNVLVRKFMLNEFMSAHRRLPKTKKELIEYFPKYEVTKEIIQEWWAFLPADYTSALEGLDKMTISQAIPDEGF